MKMNGIYAWKTRVEKNVPCRAVIKNVKRWSRYANGHAM